MKRHGIHLQEVSDDKEESTKEAKPQGDFNLVRLFKLVLEASSNPQLKVSTYDGSLNAEELIDWINKLDKYLTMNKLMKIRR